MIKGVYFKEGVFNLINLVVRVNKITERLTNLVTRVIRIFGLK